MSRAGRLCRWTTATGTFACVTSSLRFAVVAALLLGAGTVACSSDPGDAATTTAAPTTTVAAPTTTLAPQLHDIVGTALTANVFGQLAGMVVDAGLVDTLRSAGPFTVFAPTDAAFEKLPVDALHAVQDDPKLLATVLTYHVVPGALKLADLKPGKLTTVAGIDLTVTRQGDKVFVNGSEVKGDVVASNGVIHVLDDVLLPPS